MAAAFFLISLGLADTTFARAVLAEYADATRTGTYIPKRPVPVAVINLARGSSACNALVAPDRRTPPDCVASVIASVTREPALGVIVDLVLPAAPAPLGDADRRLFASIERSQAPVVLLRQPQSRGDGINTPLRLVSSIFDGRSAPNVHWAVAQFHGDSEGGDRYAEAYRTADGTLMPGVVFKVRQLLGSAAQPARILDGTGSDLRRLTIPIPTEPEAAPRAMAKNAGIVEVSPDELAGADLGGRVWIIGNAYVAGTGAAQDDLHARRDGQEDAGIFLMARAIHAAELGEAPVLGASLWQFMVGMIAVVTLGLISGLRYLLEQFVEARSLTLPYRPLIQTLLSLVVVAVFGQFWLHMLSVSGAGPLLPWQVADLVNEAVLVAAIVVILAPIVEWQLRYWRRRQSARQ